MNPFVRLCVLLVVPFFLSSCSDEPATGGGGSGTPVSGTNGGSGGSGSGGSEGSKPGAPKGAAKLPNKEVKFSWRDCGNADGTNGVASSTLTNYKDSKTVLTTFLDSACNLAALKVESNSSFYLDKNEQLQSQLKSVTATPTNPAVVATLNDKKICGFSDWAFGKSKELKGSECESELNETFQEIEKSVRDYIKNHQPKIKLPIIIKIF